MKNLKNIKFILLLLFVLNSCEKYETPSNGENSFYCEINGIPYHPKSQESLLGDAKPLFVNYYDGIDYLKINASDIDTKYYIVINLQYFEGEGDYYFQDHYEHDDPNINNYIKVSRSIVVNGQIETTTYITYDDTTKSNLKIVEFNGSSIFKGEFNATLFNIDNEMETMEIINGRFDINTDTLE